MYPICSRMHDPNVNANLQREKTLVNNRNLTKVRLAELENRGCARQNVVVNTSWTHEECTTHLTELLPKPFGLQHRTNLTKSAWVMVGKDKSKLAVVEGIAKPTGADLWSYRTEIKNGKENIKIILGAYFN